MKKAQFKNVSHIYLLFDALDTESLKKLVVGDNDNLKPDDKARIDEIKQIADEIGWNNQDLVKALNIVISNRSVTK